MSRNITTTLWLALLLTPVSLWATPEDIQLSIWANEAIITTYTFSDKNIVPEQQQIAHYFTAKGWIAYNAALKTSGLLETIQQNHLNVSAVATTPPQIEIVRPNTWRAVMPVLVVYKNEHYQQKQTLAVTIQFVRVTDGSGVRNLAIESLQTKEIKEPCKCDVSS